MRGDLLSGGIPKRLLCRDGKWTLEVVRQVAVERNVYRPHVQRLEGQDVILGYLKRSGQFQTLADEATGLLDRPVSDSRSYEVVNGEWIQSVLAPSYIEELKRQHRATAQKSHRVQLLEVRAECIRLRHANSKLLGRVDELERRLDTLFALVEELKTRQPVAVHTSARATAEPEAEPREEAVGEERSDAETAELPTLKLPRAAEFIRCIEQLIGSDVTAKEVEEHLEVTSGEKMFGSLIVDDEDRVVGAVVLDVMAAVFLGGTLLMVPEAELQAQVRSRKPSEDSIAASSEVCNALSGSLNNVADNIHIRTQYLEELALHDVPWLSKPRLQMTLEDSLGGRILVACR